MADSILMRHPFINSAIHDKVIGTIFGSAIGDSVGLYTEFLSKDLAYKSYPDRKFSLLEPVTPFRYDSHRNKFNLQCWTDDTDHALLIILAFLHNSDGGIPCSNDFASRLHVWVKQGLRCLDTLPLGLGATVGRVVLDKTFLEDPEGTAHKHWASKGYHNAANGSLMRSHPLGVMCLLKPLCETFRVATEFSLVTHPDPRCVISCCISVGLIRGLVLGEIVHEEHVDELIERAVEWYELQRERKENTSGEEIQVEDPALDTTELWKHARAKDLSELELDDSQKMGYVYKALGASLLLLRLAMRNVAATFGRLKDKLSLFEKLITSLVMEAGDADTNACVAGAFLGAYLGYMALPPPWRDGLKYGNWLLGKCESVSQIIGISQGKYDGKADPDTAPDGGKGFLTEEDMEKRVQEFTMRILLKDKEQRSKEEIPSSRFRGMFGRRK
jgi:ADP-ribosylglycohydrolase